jgi:hypothetical protein
MTNQAVPYFPYFEDKAYVGDGEKTGPFYKYLTQSSFNKEGFS